MEKPENSKRRIILRSAESCADNQTNNDSSERKQRLDSEDNSGKRSKPNKKDRKSSTTHDGKGSERF